MRRIRIKPRSRPLSGRVRGYIDEDARREALGQPSQWESSDFNPKQLYYWDGVNLKLGFHAGQQCAWDSAFQYTYILAGTQSGKTSFGPWWLWREIYDELDPQGRPTPWGWGKGGGDYLAVTSTYDLFKLKLLPELRMIFEKVLGLGRYWAGVKVIELRDPSTGRFWAKNADDPMWGRIILRSAQSKGGLESSTAKAAWLDECGQPEFGLDAYEAVLRRLSLARGRILGTTTLYQLGWLKTQVYDKARAGHPSYRIIQFPSYVNPLFSKEEYEAAAERLPLWKLLMFYRGEFSRPAGLIYDVWNEEEMVIPWFEIDPEWPVYGGFDPGNVAAGALRVVHNPDTDIYYITDEYLQGGKTAKEHARSLKDWNCQRLWGGAPGENQWRLELGAGGLLVEPPLTTEVELGINCVYGLNKKKQVYVFDTCKRYIDMKTTYSRKLDASGEPTEEIKDKSKYHLLDVERYIFGSLRPDLANTGTGGINA